MKKMFTFLAVLLFASVSFAQTSMVVADNVANSGSMYYFHGRHVARTTTGTLVVIWVDKAATGGQVNYSVYDKDFQIWSPAAAVSKATTRADKPGIAADELGNLHATWQEISPSTSAYVIMYSKFNGVSWSEPVKVSLYDAKACEEPSIEVDSKNNIWIVYNNDGAGVGNEFVFAVKSTDGGTTWSTTADKLSALGAIGSSITNGRCTLAAGPDGKIAAVWHDGQPWNNARREIFVNQYDGSAWQGEVMISDTTSVDRKENWYPTIAVDKNANIYVMYHTNADGSDPRQMILQKKTWAQDWTAGSKKVIFVDTTADMLSTSAVADANGVIHFVYRRDLPNDTTGIDAIYYSFSKDGGETWAPQIKVGRDNHDGGYVTVGNKVRTEYGVDIAFRESVTELVGDESTTAVIYANIPYSIITTDIGDEPQVPSDFEIISNYPNPFNPSTNIEFRVVKAGSVDITVYDMLGRVVKNLVNAEMNPGSYKTNWDGSDSKNMPVTSGVYIARLKTQTGIQTVKMQLLK